MFASNERKLFGNNLVDRFINCRFAQENCQNTACLAQNMLVLEDRMRRLNQNQLGTICLHVDVILDIEQKFGHFRTRIVSQTKPQMIRLITLTWIVLYLIKNYKIFFFNIKLQ